MAELSVDYVESSLNDDLKTLDELLHEMYLTISQMNSLRMKYRTISEKAEALAEQFNLDIIWLPNESKPQLQRKKPTLDESKEE